MQRGCNIGIAAKADDPLVIIDIDDMEQVPDIKPTLQTISRKRIGRHNYFFAKDETAKRNIAADTAGEVRACWQYVVAPGSYVPCGEKDFAKMPEEEKVNAGHYTVFKELPVSEITYAEFPQAYKNSDMARKIVDTEAAIRKIVPKTSTKKSYRSSALWDLSIEDVSGLSDTKGKRVPMPFEIHDSGTYKNCSVSQGLLHCWRHEVSHNAFSYLCILAGVMTCENAGLQHGGRHYGADATDGETVFRVWKYAKEKGMIPNNDPIPLSALKYFARSKGICKEIKDGKLTSLQYQIAVAMLKKEVY